MTGLTISGFPRVSGFIRLRIDRGARISIGKGVRLNSGSTTLNPYGSSQVIVLAALHNGHILIEDNVGISNSCIVALKSVHISSGTIIGGATTISDSDHHADSVLEGIFIGENSWIGGNVLIKKNVSLAPFTIVASGSVVTKSYTTPSLTLAGVPAFPIHTR